MNSQFPNTFDILQLTKSPSSKTLLGHFPQSLPRFSYCKRVVRTRLQRKEPCISHRKLRISACKASDSTSTSLAVTQNEEDDAESAQLFEVDFSLS